MCASDLGRLPVFRSFCFFVRPRLDEIAGVSLRPNMGKKKPNNAYNDHLDGEKLRDNAEIRTSLQESAPLTQGISTTPPTINSNSGARKTSNGHCPIQKHTPLTHFLCLPLVTSTSLPQLQHGLDELKKDLLATTSIPSTAVRPASTLHLTLGVMSLDPAQLMDAISYLHALDLHTILRDITHLRIAERAAAAAAADGTVSENLTATAMPDAHVLTVDVEGLLPMHRPQDTSVLYAEPRDASARLGDFAGRINKAFEEVGRGLGNDKRGLKLHATVLNTIYAAKAMRKRARENRGMGNDHGEQTLLRPSANPSRNLRFDARELIDRYKGFVWAQDVTIDRVCICKMGARKVWSGGVEGVGEVVDEVYEVVAEKSIFL